MKSDRLSPEERQEWAALYVLGVLGEEERAFFEEHFLDDCRKELRLFREIAADLALSASFEEPPARLRDRLLQRLREREGSEEP